LSKKLADLNLQLTDWPACHSCLRGGTKGASYLFMTAAVKFVLPKRGWLLIRVTLDPDSQVPVPLQVVYTWKQRMLLGKLKL